MRCPECGFDVSAPVATHVYAVRLRTGGNAKRWYYSVPVTKAEARREHAELRATGHETALLEVGEVAAHQQEHAPKPKRGGKRKGGA